MIFHIIEPEWMYDEKTGVYGHIDGNYLSAGGFPSMLYYLLNYVSQKYILQLQNSIKLSTKLLQSNFTKKEQLIIEKCSTQPSSFLWCISYNKIYTKWRLFLFFLLMHYTEIFVPKKFAIFLQKIFQYLKYYSELMLNLNINKDLYLTWEADLGYGAKFVANNKLDKYTIWHDLYVDTNYFNQNPYFQFLYKLGRNKRDKLLYMLHSYTINNKINAKLSTLISQYHYYEGAKLYSLSTFPYAYSFLSSWKTVPNFSLESETDLYWYFSSIFNTKAYHYTLLKKYSIHHIPFSYDINLNVHNPKFVYKIGHTITTGGKGTFQSHEINTNTYFNYPIIKMPKLQFTLGYYKNIPLYGHIRVLGITTIERQIFHLGFLLKLSLKFNSSGYKSIFIFLDKNFKHQLTINRLDKVPTVHFKKLKTIRLTQKLEHYLTMAYKNWYKEITFLNQFFSTKQNIIAALQLAKEMVEKGELDPKYDPCKTFRKDAKEIKIC